MIMILKSVIVFTKNCEKNEVSFKNGLNIISGVSQTGKSAIIEIVDYCLASTTCSIPKGVIEDNSILYSIVLELKNKYLILARRPVFYEDRNQRGKRRMFLKVEAKDNFNIENINYNYYENNNQCYRPLEDIKKEIENFLGVAVYKKIDSNDSNNINGERVSIRNMVSFLFQHQNLVANKFALFYRFDDFNKMKKTIAEFPIFMGIVDQEYYNIFQKNEINKKILRKLEKAKKEDDEYNKEKVLDIEVELKEYYNLINKDLSEFKFNNIISEKERIDKFLIEDLEIDDGIKVYKTLEDSLKELNSEIYKLQNKIYNINNTLESGSNTEEIINNVRNIDDNKEVDNMNYCPFCNSKMNKLSDKIRRINEARINLDESLQAISKIKTEYLLEERYKIQSELDKYLINKEELVNKIKNIKEKNKIIEKRLDLKDLIIEKRIRLEDNIKKLNYFKNESYDTIDELKDEIELLEKKLYGYNVENSMKEMEYIINKFMNKVAEKLDFEEKYKPVNLKFDSNTFDLYQYQNNDRIYLSNMGSGSNWLTCHLALFLALHYIFAKLDTKCSIPSFLIIDQPSQIYFPSFNQKEKDIDIVSVEKIYKAIKWAISYIEKETKNEIQVIVLDHAMGLNFDDREFDYFIRKRWNIKGDGLIKKENIIQE